MTSRILNASGGKIVTPSFVSAGITQTTSNSGTLNANAPATIAAGNLLIAFISTSGTQTGTWTLPAGWTSYAQYGDTPNTLVAYKIATGSEPATYAFSFSRTNVTYHATILQYKDAAIGIRTDFAAKSGNTNLIPVPEGANPYYKGVTLICTATVDNGVTWTSRGGGLVPRVNDSNNTDPSVLIEEEILSGFTKYYEPTFYDVVASSNAGGGSIIVFLRAPDQTTVFSKYYDEEYGNINTPIFTDAFTITSGSGTMSGDGSTEFSVNGGAFVTSASVAPGNSIVVRSTSTSSYNQKISNRRVTLNNVSFNVVINTANFRIFTASATGTNGFRCPWGINTVSMLCLGGGAGGETGGTPSLLAKGGGGGGGLSYTNDVTVTPGEYLNINVGAAGSAGSTALGSGPGGASSIVRQSNSTTLVSAAGGTNTTTGTGGAGGAAASGVGTVRFSGGNGGNSNGSTLGGGGGGGAATPAGNGATGPTGVTGTSQTGGSGVGGAGGVGIDFTSTGWTTAGPTLNNNRGSLQQFDAVAGNPKGGGGGGGAYFSSNATWGWGGAGTPGIVVLLWAGRTFSASSTY